jgi:hypothetical protein
LSIATRCPRCGQDLPTPPIRWEPSRNPVRRRRLPARARAIPAALGRALLAWWGVAGDRAARVTAAITPEPAFALDTARSAASPAMPDSAPSPEAVPRYARTWTKVHDRRSPKADVVAVLLPGDTVLADSLQGGWWRVALDRRVLGYVYGRTLAQTTE